MLTIENKRGSFSGVSIFRIATRGKFSATYAVAPEFRPNRFQAADLFVRQFRGESFGLKGISWDANMETGLSLRINFRIITGKFLCDPRKRVIESRPIRSQPAALLPGNSERRFQIERRFGGIENQAKEGSGLAVSE
jgi:hypothetical protein